jgi:hypothetical protein
MCLAVWIQITVLTCLVVISCFFRSREICMCRDRTSCQLCFLFQRHLLAFYAPFFVNFFLAVFRCVYIFPLTTNSKWDGHAFFLFNQLTIELRFDSLESVMLSLLVLRMNVRFNIVIWRLGCLMHPWKHLKLSGEVHFLFYFLFLEVLISMFFRLVVAYHHFPCSGDLESVSYCKTAQCLISESTVKACQHFLFWFQLPEEGSW